MMYHGKYICVNVELNIFFTHNQNSKNTVRKITTGNCPLEEDFLTTSLPLMLIHSLIKSKKRRVMRVKRESGNLLVAWKFNPKVMSCSGAFTSRCHMWSNTHDQDCFELMVLPIGLLCK